MAQELALSISSRVRIAHNGQASLRWSVVYLKRFFYRSHLSLLSPIADRSLPPSPQETDVAISYGPYVQEEAYQRVSNGIGVYT